MEEYRKLKKRKGFKYEWNNFSLFCWYLLEKGIEDLASEERTELKKEIRSCTDSQKRVQLLMSNDKVMRAVQDQVQHLQTKVRKNWQKDQRLSELSAQRADDSFTMGNFEKALRLYSKAILFFATPETNISSSDKIVESEQNLPSKSLEPMEVAQQSLKSTSTKATSESVDSSVEIEETGLQHAESESGTDAQEEGEEEEEEKKGVNADVVKEPEMQAETSTEKQKLSSETNHSKTATHPLTMQRLLWQRAITLERLNRFVDASRDLHELYQIDSSYRTKANQSFQSETLQTDPEMLRFQVDHENESLEGASDALRMEYSEMKGRLIYSRRPIAEGELLFAERPYAHWLRPSCYSTYCHHCLQRLPNHWLYPCSRCIRVRFCSSHCARQAETEYHHIECQLLPVISHWASGHMSLRLLLRDGLDQVIGEEQKPTPNPEQWPSIGFYAKYNCIRSLIGEQNFTDADYYCPLVLGSVLMANLLQATQIINQSHTQLFAGLLLRSLMQILENTFMIYDNSMHPIENAVNNLKSAKMINPIIESSSPAFNSKQETNPKMQNQLLCISSQANKIGVGLYSAASLISHSCDNNAFKYYNGSQIVIVAAKSVSTDSEVSIEYGAHYKMNSLADRRQYLMANFGFKCCCSACNAHLENIGWSFRCPVCSEGAVVRNADGSVYCFNGECSNDQNEIGQKESDNVSEQRSVAIKSTGNRSLQDSLEQCDRVAEMADVCFRNALQAYKKGNCKTAEQQLRRCEQLQSQLYYSDIKLHQVRAQLSAFYAATGDHMQAYQTLSSTFAMNQDFYGENSFEAFSCLVDMCCLLVLHLRHLAELGCLKEDSRGRLQYVKGGKSALSKANADQSPKIVSDQKRQVQLSSTELSSSSNQNVDKEVPLAKSVIGRRLKNLANLFGVFRLKSRLYGSSSKHRRQVEEAVKNLSDHFIVLKELLNKIMNRQIKIVNEESSEFVNKLLYLDGVMMANGQVNVPSLLES